MPVALYSDSNSEEGREMEDMVDNRGKFFPTCSNRRPAKMEAGSDSDVEIDRLDGTQWCHCGQCAVMPTARECRCCSEIDQVRTVMDEEGAACITLHPGFEAVCLNSWVLQTAYYVYRQQYGGRAQENSIQEKYRHTAYRQLVRMCWQF
ncbi:uncharacterized protein [Apostichopus japonicus]|uniref:uncharacterized protein n=1 Tax=Stichopus japonicus TaxID=307972 RepID=UPI003AB17226